MVALFEHLARNFGDTLPVISSPALRQWRPAIEEKHRAGRRLLQSLTQFRHRKALKLRYPTKLKGNAFQICERESICAAGIEAFSSAQNVSESLAVSFVGYSSGRKQFE